MPEIWDTLMKRAQTRVDLYYDLANFVTLPLFINLGLKYIFLTQI